MKIVTIVGARPQFIKDAVIQQAVDRWNGRGAGERIEKVLVHTGQHYDYNMSKVFFEELRIPEPKYNLCAGSGSHGRQTGAMLAPLEEALAAEKPGAVLVYGDTNSTLAGALCAARLGLPVVHVEAGLRSYNRAMPEEINRVLTDELAQVLVCPTERAVENLKAEGIEDGQSIKGMGRRRVLMAGDVMYDLALQYGRIAREKSRALERLGLAGEGGTREYYLCTIHRAENTDAPARLGGILSALRAVAELRPVVLPLHPRTRALAARHGLSLEGLAVTDPVSYLDMLQLEQHAAAVLTDSGGVQKEAYFFRVPAVVLRDETEWGEIVECGWNVLAGAEPERIRQAVERASSAEYARKPYPFLYGRGDSAALIIDALQKGVTA